MRLVNLALQRVSWYPPSYFSVLQKMVVPDSALCFYNILNDDINGVITRRLQTCNAWGDPRALKGLWGVEETTGKGGCSSRSS